MTRPLRLGDQVVDRGHDVALAGGVAGALGVGGVRDEQQHAVLAGLRELVQVAGLAVGGVVVELEVARVHHPPERRVDDQAAVVGDRVGHAEEVDGEVLADLDAVVGRDLVQIDVGLGELELLELAAQQAQRELGAVHRDLGQQLDHVGQPADVVLVAVRQHPALDLVGVLDHPVDPGDQDVDPEHVGVGEREPPVDEQDLALVLEGEHVLADLAHAAQRDDAKFAVVRSHDTPLVSIGAAPCSRRGTRCGCPRRRRHAPCRNRLLRGRPVGFTDGPCSQDRGRRGPRVVPASRGRRAAVGRGEGAAVRSFRCARPDRACFVRSAPRASDRGRRVGAAGPSRRGTGGPRVAQLSAGRAGGGGRRGPVHRARRARRRRAGRHRCCGAGSCPRARGAPGRSCRGRRWR